MISFYVTMMYIFAVFGFIVSVRNSMILGGKVKPKLICDKELMKKYEAIHAEQVKIGMNPNVVRWIAVPVSTIMISVVWPYVVYKLIKGIFK